MAGCGNNRYSLTPNKLEFEAHRLMGNGLHSDNEFLDQAIEYSEHQTDIGEELSDNDEGSVYTRAIKYQDEKCGEKSLIVPIPRYIYFLGHVVFFLLGVCNFLPMTFFAAANNRYAPDYRHQLPHKAERKQFWLYKFRNISDPSESVENRTLLQRNFASATIISSTVFSLAFGIFNVTLSHRYKIKSRLIISLCIEVLVFILFTISVKVDTDHYQVTFFVLMSIGLGTLAAANTVAMLASMSLYPRFPPTYMKICFVGQGSAGIVGNILNIVIVTCFRGDIIRSTLLYFVFGTVAVTTTLILSVVLSRTTLFQNCFASIPQNTDRKVPSRRELKRIVYKIWYPLVLIFIYAIGDATTHPAITALVVSEQDLSSSSWAKYYFSPVMTFLLADSSFLIGRMMSSYTSFKISDTPFLLISVVRSLVLVPFIWLCNAQPRNHLPVLFSDDYQYAIILGSFMITNGYIVNEGIISVLAKVDKHETDMAYGLLGLGTNIMHTLGAPIGLFIVNIL